MLNLSRDLFLRSVFLALVGIVCICGCSGGGPKTVPVYGTITFVGRDAPKVCNVFFLPIKVEGIIRPSSTERQADGTYAVKAFQSSKGLIPGTYKVRVLYYDLKPGANPAIEASWRETAFEAGELLVDASSSGVEHDIEVPAKQPAPKKNFINCHVGPQKNWSLRRLPLEFLALTAWIWLEFQANSVHCQ